MLIRKNAHKSKIIYFYIFILFRSCSICLENYKGSDKIVEFSCKNHIFHKECLKGWIRKNDLCPLCKYNMMQDYINQPDDDE